MDTKTIFSKIEKLPAGAVITTVDFGGKKNRQLASKALATLVKQNKLSRIAKGVYYKANTNAVFGEMPPSTEAIADAIARLDGARIQQGGAKAAFELGLIKDTPATIEYLTNKDSKVFTLDGLTITFRHATPRQMRGAGTLSAKVLTAINYVGPRIANQADTINILSDALVNTDITELNNLAANYPSWTLAIIQRVIKQIETESRMAVPQGIQRKNKGIDLSIFATN